MAEIKWIKITTDIFDDEKILLIESMPEADAIIVIWFKLLCLAGKHNNSGVFLLNDKIAYTEDMLTTIFRRKKATVQLALQTFEQLGMIELVDGVITIPNWEKHQNIDQLDKIKEQSRLRTAKHREKQRLLLEGSISHDSNVTVTLPSRDSSVTVALASRSCNAIEEDIDKEKDKEEDIKEKNTKKESRASGSPGGGVVEEFTDDADLQEAIRSFIEMRKLIKKPLTDKALSLMLKKLAKLSDNTQEQIEILNQSVTGCWQGIYPLEGHEGQAQTKSAVNGAKPSARVGNKSTGVVAGPGQPAPKKWDENKGRYVFWDENSKRYRDRDNPYEKSMSSLYGEEGYEDIVYNDEDDIRWCYQLGHYVYRDPATGAYVDKQTGAVVTESML